MAARTTRAAARAVVAAAVVAVAVLAVVMGGGADASPCGGQAARHQCTSSSSCRPGRVAVFGHGGLCLPGEQCCMAGSDARCTASGGRCGHRSTCAAGHSTGKCPGNRDIVCCAANSAGFHFGHQRATEVLDDNDEPPTSGRSIRITPEVVARAAAAAPRRETPRAPSGDGLCFPLERAASQRPPSATSFASVRPHNGGDFTRCHAGIDLYGEGNAVAMADGVVKNIFGFLNCRKGMSFAVLVWHSSMGMTVNYGEINYDTLVVKIGQRVSRGQLLGRVGYCGMLHVEFYNGERSANVRWNLPRPSSSTNACKDQPKPGSIINGYNMLKDLYDKGSFCTGSLVKNACTGGGAAGYCAGNKFCPGSSSNGRGRCDGYGSSRQFGAQNPSMVCCHS